jgi:hypothetical protein
MAERTAVTQSEHDRVVRAWAQVLEKGLIGGCRVSTNPGSNRSAQVGSVHEPRFPDVVVWRAEAGQGRDGTAELISEIETSDTLTDDEVLSEWTGYARVPAPFYLVVPEGLESKAMHLIRKTPVRVSQLWSYRIDGHEIMFTQFIALPAL